MNIEAQPNGNDCGALSLACVTGLVHGCDPVLCSWDVPKMRHLLEKGHLDRFPCTGQRRVRFSKSVKEELYCSCCMPNDKAIAMIYCDHCKRWYAIAIHLQ